MAKTNTALPAQGEAQTITQKGHGTEDTSNARDASKTSNAFNSDAPVDDFFGDDEEAETEKKVKRSLDALNIEGLGRIDMDDDGRPSEPKEEEGEGAHVVILASFVSSPTGAIVQGRVVRISRLLPTWKTDKKQAKEEAARLFRNAAIRLATSDEAQMHTVDLKPERETHEVNEERARRIEAERKAAELEERLKILEGKSKE